MEPPSSHVIAILNESGRRASRPLIERAIRTTLDLHGRHAESVSLLIGTDETIRELNRRFRGLDEATDVLSFPSNDVQGAPLGDIAIALPYAERQAQARRVSLIQELGYLAIHGTLHLLGFDDATEPDRREMVAEMNRCAIASGLKPDENWASIHSSDSTLPSIPEASAR